MAKSRYFCVAAKTTIHTDNENKITTAPATQMVLYMNMNVGIKSVLYKLWKESQTDSTANNEFHIDAENNLFSLVQTDAAGMKKMVTWLVLPCRGVKWNDTFTPVEDIQDAALDFVGDMYAEYNLARVKYITEMISEGVSDDEIQAAGITPEEVSKEKLHASAADE